MKPEAPPVVASAIPGTVGEPVVAQPPKIPLAAKLAGTAFLALLVPVYWHTYGPTNFLWFCDAALILTVAGMWLESSPGHQHVLYRHSDSTVTSRRKPGSTKTSISSFGLAHSGASPFFPRI